jgi:hypothetical protein
MPGLRPALVMLLLSLVGGDGDRRVVSVPEPWLRLVETLMVVFDLCKGTGLI